MGSKIVIAGVYRLSPPGNMMEVVILVATGESFSSGIQSHPIPCISPITLDCYSSYIHP